MKVNGVNVILNVDDKGMDSLLFILGYPPENRMDKWDWKDFYPEADAFVETEHLFDMERQLAGERVYQHPLENMRPKETDDMYDEYIDYKEGE